MGFYSTWWVVDGMIINKIIYYPTYLMSGLIFISWQVNWIDYFSLSVDLFLFYLVGGLIIDLLICVCYMLVSLDQRAILAKGCFVVLWPVGLIWFGLIAS